MPERPINVLFLSAGNPARSFLAEATLNHIGKGRFCAFSADNSPSGNQQPHPLAAQVLQNAGIPAESLRGRRRDEFGTRNSPVMDLVITMCDHAGGEVCPSWPDAPALAHWRYPDPSTLPGGKRVKLWAFEQTLEGMRQRLELLVNLPPDRLERAMVQQAARDLSRA